MISELSIKEFQQRINRFDRKYVDDWLSWLDVATDDKPDKLGAILRKWQACRPNTMRRTKTENLHESPYLEDLIDKANDSLQELQLFEISKPDSFSHETSNHLSELWGIFENLSYKGKSRSGKAGVVGISKAVLLLSDGRIGPAFDSEVRGHLGLNDILNAKQWFNALRKVSKDIQCFESTNEIKIKDAAPQEFQHLYNGRIYDMALGPGK